MGRLAIKRLSGSDLTFFEWQNAQSRTNQKCINLNADVFVKQLYPELLSTDPGRDRVIPIQTFLFGPGHAKAFSDNHKHKITKKSDSYKNWRLNGTVVKNPVDDPTRFNSLSKGDFAVFDFEGDFFPTSVRIVFVAASVEEDAALHKGIADWGVKSMRAIDMTELGVIARMSGTPESHPIYELLLDSAIEDAAQLGLEGTRRLLSRSTGRRMKRSELLRARQRADEIGVMGEDLLNAHLALELRARRVDEFEWTSNENAIAPFDFRIRREGEYRKIDVKATTGDFKQPIHISMSELLEMRESSEPYDVYRIYEIDEGKAKLRIAENVKHWAESIVARLESLPEGVKADSVSVKPELMQFGSEIVIDLPDEPDEGELF